MYYVYVLKSINHDKIYIGFTSSLEQRLEAHNHAQNKGWTRLYMPWNIVYTESFELKSDAMLREKQLKTGKGRAFIRKEILK